VILSKDISLVNITMPIDSYNDDIISLNNYSTKLYREFPIEGWLKPCFYNNCKTITSKFTIFNYKNNTYKAYICKDCVLHRKRANIPLISQDIYKYITRNYITYNYS